MSGGTRPKRGDLLQSNIGSSRERTWLILHAREVKRHADRYALKMARWWEIKPETRMKLYRSAERNGGQRVITFFRYPPKKKSKLTFEQYMKRFTNG